MTSTDGPAGGGGTTGWGVALGGGGSVGIAYIAGALAALADEGVHVSSAGLAVGTSAGAVAAAALRNGAKPGDLQVFADAVPDEADAAVGRAPRHFEPAWSDRIELWHRMLGSSAVVARSMMRMPLPLPSRRVATAFPGGLFRPRGDGMARLLGEDWPEDPLWLIAVDLRTRRRVALGRRPEDRRHPLHRAVMASCAVPGFYEPVVLGGRYLVDGGVNSTTSIDMAVRAGCSRVVAVVPLGYADGPRPGVVQRLVRSSAVRGVRRELDRAGARARDVLVIQPHVEDLDLHGTNFFRGTANDQVTERAQERTHALLRRPEVAEFVAALRESPAG